MVRNPAMPTIGLSPAAPFVPIRLSIAGFTVLVTVSFAMAVGPILYVDHDAPGADNGSSWCDALANLQSALSVAQGSGGAVTEIRVAAGTYRPAGPNGNREATFTLLNGVSLKGGYAGCGAADPDGRDFILNETVLSGDLGSNDDEPPSTCCSPQASGGCDTPSCQAAVCAADSFCCQGQWDGQCVARATTLCQGLCDDPMVENSCRVVKAIGNSASARLDGFTIAASRSYSGCIGSSGNLLSAGVAVGSGSPSISDCQIRGNSGQDGGGMWIGTGNPLIERCTFKDNLSDNGAGVLIYDPLYPNDSTAPQIAGGIFRACAFIQNNGSNGAILASNSRTTFEDCLFRDNGASAIHSVNPQNALMVRRCRFERNTGPAVFIDGGQPHGGNPQVIDCVFIDSGSSGMYVSGPANVRVTNCSFARNQGVGVYIGNGALPLRNTILWQNGDGSQDAQIVSPNGSPVNINYSCIQGWTGALGGVGNFGSDPFFVDADSGDYHIHECSPCVNTGDPNFMLTPGDTDMDGDTRVLGVRVDIGADEVPYPDKNADGLPDNCPAPTGACCELGGECRLTIADVCQTGSWTKGGECVAGACPVLGACCEPDGTCTIMTQSECASGTWSAGATCDGCLASCCEGCDDGDVCTADSCVEGFCEHTPVLHGDIAPCGGDGLVDLTDVLMLLDAYAGNTCPCSP